MKHLSLFSLLTLATLAHAAEQSQVIYKNLAEFKNKISKEEPFILQNRGQCRELYVDPKSLIDQNNGVCEGFGFEKISCGVTPPAKYIVYQLAFKYANVHVPANKTYLLVEPSTYVVTADDWQQIMQAKADSSHMVEWWIFNLTNADESGEIAKG